MRLEAVSPAIRLGGAIVDREECRTCHAVFGEGGNRAPALAGIAGKHDKAWIVRHLRDPKGVVAGSKMPAFGNLTDAELAAVTDYLLALP